MHDGSVAAVASTATKEGYSLLHNVVVNESLRGIGLGEKLCRATIEKSKELGAEYSYLQVLQDNEAALNLYKKIGFEKIYEFLRVKTAFTFLKINKPGSGVIGDPGEDRSACHNPQCLLVLHVILLDLLVIQFSGQSTWNKSLIA